MNTRLVIGIVVCGLTSLGCIGRPELKSRQVCVDELEVLLIDQGPNSVTGRMEIYQPVDHHGALHRCGRRSIQDGGTFFEEVYQYKTVEAAEDEYTRQLEVFFFVNEFMGPWENPELAMTLDIDANEYTILCSERDSGTVLCGMVARYDNFVIRLNANRTLSSMTLEEFLEVVNEIDLKMQ